MKKNRQIAAALLALLASACSGDRGGTLTQEQSLGLFTSLPIYWQPGGALDELSAQADGSHWANTALSQSFVIAPMDALTAEELAALDILVMAQPRALSGPENVALDQWVRQGGRALVFADPMLVGHSDFPIGDRRRPQDTVLLSPILARWGLELMFDPEAPAQIERIAFDGIGFDAIRPGSFRIIDPAGGAQSACELSPDAMAAWCVVGSGRVLLVADATLLEDREGGDASLAVLESLLGIVRDGREN
ncbi:Gldg family protein [Parerythrobacter jejuensis]|uniref:ABC-type uncharacterized transport system domain-containing protein n=1 Tax=Parerythrobacter jejuensis TaxID=795812 RepID=A0A845AT00_9SPHN|nr:Gldg family protein [Parerythrobacter jejuensis]MXP31636.1 hypothetical protein [Parerythrobacter jejuensis]